MHDLHRLRYVTERYPHLQGLRLAPLGVPFLYHEVSRGTLDATLVHPREVFKAALLANAAAIIVTHYVARHIMRLMCPESLCAAVSASAPTSAARRSKKGT